MKKPKKAMFAVESNNRHSKDLGITILVLVRSHSEALATAKKLYPEHTTKKGSGGRIFPVSHAIVDWDTGKSLIIREPMRLAVKAGTNGNKDH